MQNLYLNPTELRVFNLIKEGKSRNEILMSGISTPTSLSLILSTIYNITDEKVKYHTIRDKFKELQCFLRNNPTVFNLIPANKKGNPVEDKTEYMTKEKPDVHEIIKRLNVQYREALEVNKVKLSVLADIEKELTEGA